ncbi:MAG: sialidase, partial [Bacteroidales bacterium]|nr:sialidase [Bacteroidales bacterium]
MSKHRRRLPFLVLLALMCLQPLGLRAADTVFVREKQVPVLIEREDNVLFELKLTAEQSRKLDEVVLELGEETPCKHIRAVKLYYAGTETRTYRQDAFHPVEYISLMDPGNTLRANPSYSILRSEVRKPGR